MTGRNIGLMGFYCLIEAHNLIQHAFIVSSLCSEIGLLGTNNSFHAICVGLLSKFVMRDSSTKTWQNSLRSWPTAQ